MNPFRAKWRHALMVVLVVVLTSLLTKMTTWDSLRQLFDVREENQGQENSSSSLRHRFLPSTVPGAKTEQPETPDMSSESDQKQTIEVNTGSKRKDPRAMPHSASETKAMTTVDVQVDDTEFPWYVNTSSRHSDEIRHLVFVKVHKAASTTVYNVMIRFAVSRQLKVMLPLKGNILSEFSPRMKRLLHHPPSPPFLFDLLCNHVVFNFRELSRHFPSDTRYVAIIRQPWFQVQSAFYYYKTHFRMKYLEHVSSFEEFVRHQSRFEPQRPLKSVTHNRMSLDLGLPPHYVTDASYVEAFVRHLDSVFDVVLIAERFDESMILLRRKFRWTTKDIIYEKLNALKTKRRTIETPNPFTKEIFNYFQRFDIAVYEHFANKFNQTVGQEGQDFLDEVDQYVHILHKVSQFCQDILSPAAQFYVAPTRWDAGFVFYKAECDILSVSEMEMTQWVQRRQLVRLYGEKVVP